LETLKSSKKCVKRTEVLLTYECYGRLEIAQKSDIIGLKNGSGNQLENKIFGMGIADN